MLIINLLDYILFFLFILHIAFLSTCDSYKCGGVAVWRLGEEKKGAERVWSIFPASHPPSFENGLAQGAEAKQRLKLQ